MASSKPVGSIPRIVCSKKSVKSSHVADTGPKASSLPVAAMARQRRECHWSELMAAKEIMNTRPESCILARGATLWPEYDCAAKLLSRETLVPRCEVAVGDNGLASPSTCHSLPLPIYRLLSADLGSPPWTVRGPLPSPRCQGSKARWMLIMVVVLHSYRATTGTPCRLTSSSHSLVGGDDVMGAARRCAAPGCNHVGATASHHIH